MKYSTSTLMRYFINAYSEKYGANNSVLFLYLQSIGDTAVKISKFIRFIRFVTYCKFSRNKLVLFYDCLFFILYANCVISSSFKTPNLSHNSQISCPIVFAYLQLTVKGKFQNSEHLRFYPILW